MITREGRRIFIRQTIASLSAAALAGYGTANATVAQAAPAASASPSAASSTPFAVSPSTMASIVSRPETFLLEYEALGGGSGTAAASTIRSALGPAFLTLSDTGCMAVYAAVIASNAAPLGSPPIPAMDASLNQLLQAAVLSYGHFCKLATMLAFLGCATLSPPDLSNQVNPPPATLHFLVWLDTVPLNTGYHAQLVISNALTNGYLLLDPTYGFALAIPYGPSGPQSSLTDIENAATFLEQPISAGNLVQFNSTNLASNPTITQIMVSGGLGPQYIYHDSITQVMVSGGLGAQYIYHDSISGSEGWDARIGQIIDNMN